MAADDPIVPKLHISSDAIDEWSESSDTSSPKIELLSFICPITKRAIQKAACTCLGFVYEESAIQTWLKDHTTDPMTNEHLPSLDLVILGPVSGSNIRQIHEKVAEIRDMNRKCMLTTKLSGFQFHHTEKFHAILLKQKLVVDTLPAGIWSTYAKMKRDLFLDDNRRRAHPYPEKSDDDDTIPRPAGTGFSYQFIDLSNTHSTKGHFKGDRFDFANLKDCVFVKCDFSRCTFIGANLDGCMFINCSFQGEEVCFHHASGTPSFIDSTVEMVERWHLATGREAKQSIRDRGMENFKFAMSE